MLQHIKLYKFDLYLRSGSVIRNCLSQQNLPSLSDDVIDFTFNLSDQFKNVMVRSSDVLLISLTSVINDPNQPTDVMRVEFE